ncbi:restriction endonuclease subunit M [Synergistales bacterium]|nr:restriction endonuclease subunit M [Synergistales bacterium]
MKENKLFYGDNLDVMRKYIGDETIDLCYIDPPFNSSRNYNQIYNNVGKDDTAQAQAFVDTWTWNDIAEDSFRDIHNNPLCPLKVVHLLDGLMAVIGRGSLLAYLVSITQRVAEIRRVLKPTGSFYLHCDPTASHYLKLVLDCVFCEKSGDFVNEIVWCYETGGRSNNFFPRKHDVIFFYTKDAKNFTFNDADIRLARDTSTMHEPVLTDEEGRQYQRNIKNGKEYRYYLTHGVLPNDYWIDIQALNPAAKERLGYPTQKPEALLERIIKASSNEGNTVLDAYCGCGTTVAVAQRLKRKWIGIDITYQSISLILKRLEDTYGREVLDNAELNGIPRDMESAAALAQKEDDRTRKEFEKWVVLTYSNNQARINEQKGSDKGIDGMAFIAGADAGTQKVLFSVKSGKVSVSHVRDLRGTVEREGAAGGILITLSPPTKDMIAEAASAGNMENAAVSRKIHKIKIVTVGELLDGERMTLPLAYEVLKKAQRERGKNKDLDFE